MIKQHVHLSDSDRTTLQELLRRDSVKLATYRRARALLALDEGATLVSTAALVEVNYNCVSHWTKRYVQEGLALLEDKPRSGRPPYFAGTQRAKITALACSTPPEGHARWSVRLLQDKAVELDYVEAISHDTVHQILKKTNSSRT